MSGGGHGQTIGQVLFVPREEVSLRPCTDEELAAIRDTQAEFAREKAAHNVDHFLRHDVQPPLPAIQPLRQAVSTVE